jgi:hypothetical protein
VLVLVLVAVDLDESAAWTAEMRLWVVGRERCWCGLEVGLNNGCFGGRRDREVGVRAIFHTEKAGQGNIY